MADNSLKQGTLFQPELVKELISKVQGRSVLAKLSSQTPIPFNGVEQFIFSLEGNAQIVGEGQQKGAGKANIESKVIKPLKFVYQTRITDEFKYASEEKQLEYLSQFADGFAKKIADAFDIAAIHGLEPKGLTDATFRDTNSFDGLITTNIVNYAEDKFDDNIDAAVQQIVAKGGEVTGVALSPVGGQSLAKLKVNGVTQYPEFRFGQNPDSFYGMKSDVNKNSLWGCLTLKVNELLDEYQVTLYLFPETMWERRGFYFPDERIIYVNRDLSLEEREEVILHELGHINHNPAHYKRLLYKYENEADRFMIRHLISEELAQYEVSDFNWLQFAERHKISTTWGEDMIQEEFYRLTGS